MCSPRGTDRRRSARLPGGTPRYGAPAARCGVFPHTGSTRHHDVRRGEDDPRRHRPGRAHRRAGEKTGPIDSGVLGRVGTVYAALDPDLVAIVCPPGAAADHRLGDELYGPVPLAEIMHHKIEGQYREYHAHHRPVLLAAAETLDRERHPLAGQMCAAEEPAMTRTLACGRTVTSAYCSAVQASLRYTASARCSTATSTT